MEAEVEIAVIIIGRNEGPRLRVCIESARAGVSCLVYVDSGSSDGSVELARQLGVTVVELDPAVPFTAARARNAGAKVALRDHGDVGYLQFVDGDCEFAAGWMRAAREYLGQHPEVAVVCGRRRERFPDASIYHRLCDMEWNTPVGRASEFGGDAMIGAAAFGEVGGYRETLIAGEEPELALRLRRGGWQIVRLDCDMTVHDINMKHFQQWWKRTVRSGHAMAERAALHGRTPPYAGVRDCASVLFWVLVLPLVMVGLSWLVHGWALVLLVCYAVLTWRIAWGRCVRGDPVRAAWAYGVFCVLGKVPQLCGIATFWLNRVRGRRTGLIEYRGVAAVPPALPLTTVHPPTW